MKVNHGILAAILSALLVLPFNWGASAQAAVSAPQKGVVFGEAGDEKLALDVYGADPTQKRPGIVFLFGGGWVAGSREDVAGPALAFADKGYVCFAVSYRLVQQGKNRFPAQIDDAQRAVRWIRAHAADYGLNPDKLGALGLSAGGQLAALLGTTDTRDNSIPELAQYSSRVQAVVDLYGPTDFTTPTDDQTGDVQTRDQLLEGFLGPLPENAANYREASPVLHVDKKSAPFLIFHGAKDTLVPVVQSQRLDETLRNAGIESKLVVFPNAGHAYNDPDLLIQTFVLSVQFFDRHLKN